MIWLYVFLMYDSIDYICFYVVKVMEICTCPPLINLLGTQVWGKLLSMMDPALVAPRNLEKFTKVGLEHEIGCG